MPFAEIPSELPPVVIIKQVVKFPVTDDIAYPVPGNVSRPLKNAPFCPISALDLLDSGFRWLSQGSKLTTTDEYYIILK